MDYVNELRLLNLVITGVQTLSEVQAAIMNKDIVKAGSHIAHLKRISEAIISEMNKFPAPPQVS